jgi:hypothetical protein
VRIVHYINLTAGIEAVPENPEFRFVRIQSTHCEQKLWDEVFMSAGADLLMNLALGNKCVVHDRSAGGGMSRAQWQGLELLSYVLSVRWFGREDDPCFRGHVDRKYARKVYSELSTRTVKYLDYFKQFLMTGRVRLEVDGGLAGHKDKKAFYRAVLKVHR